MVLVDATSLAYQRNFPCRLNCLDGLHMTIAINVNGLPESLSMYNPYLLQESLEESIMQG